MDALLLKRYVDARAHHADTRRLETLLDRIIPRPDLHARFVNTLARLEYVGVRKMLKSRRAERLDLDGLQHLLDEAVHALRLKKAPSALGRGRRRRGDHVLGRRHAGGRSRRSLFPGAGPSCRDRARRCRARTAALSDRRRRAPRRTTCSPARPSRSARRRSIRCTSSACARTARRSRSRPSPRMRIATCKRCRNACRRCSAPAPRGLDGVLAEEEVLYGRFLAALEAAIDAAELASGRRGAGGAHGVRPRGLELRAAVAKTGRARRAARKMVAMTRLGSGVRVPDREPARRFARASSAPARAQTEPPPVSGRRRRPPRPPTRGAPSARAAPAAPSPRPAARALPPPAPAPPAVGCPRPRPRPSRARCRPCRRRKSGRRSTSRPGSGRWPRSSA